MKDEQRIKDNIALFRKTRRILNGAGIAVPIAPIFREIIEYLLEELDDFSASHGRGTGRKRTSKA